MDDKITFHDGTTTHSYKRIREIYDDNSIQIAMLNRIEELEAQVDKLNGDIQIMVEKAVSKHRPAYDEQSMKIMKLEAALERVRGLPDKWRDRYNFEVNSTGFRADELIDCGIELMETLK